MAYCSKADSALSLLAYRTFTAPLNTVEKFAGKEYGTLCIFPAHTGNALSSVLQEY